MALPALREELRIQEAGNDWDGSPCWLIHDLQSHRFHRIGWLEFELLIRWDLGDSQKIIDAVSHETTLKPTEDDVVSILKFLEDNYLIRVTSPEGTVRLSTRANYGVLSLEKWLLHNYLFFRIPLLKSDKLLTSITPYISPLLTTNCLIIFMLIACIGLYLAARQWDVFTGNFINTLTPAGYFSYAVALSIAKCIHEMGHALLAKKHGIRVPRIGVAFLVMFPVLYTDLGEGWLLKDHRCRRLVSAGGILAEGALSALSLFMWGVLSDGFLRDAFYILAVVSIGRSLLINISPFMRFDGYYLLSDHFNLPNLQQRAFAYTRYLFRRIIFGVSDEPPEVLPRRISNFFWIYSVTTWLYRLVVFFGIALTVYHYFFKTLGIILMLVELIYFIALPIVRELLVWRKQMVQVAPARYTVLIAIVSLLLLTLFIPWRGSIILPAILTAREKQPVYSPFAARIASIPEPGGAYKAGDQLYVLDAEEARFQLKVAKIQTDELRMRLRSLPLEAKGLEQASVWREQLLEREQTIKAYSEELHRLILRADYDGVIFDMDEGITPGSYVTPHTLLGVLVNMQSIEIEAFADQNASEKLVPDTSVTFYGKSKADQVLKGKVVSVDYSRLTSLPTIALADRHGGDVATIPSSGERLAPKESLYRVRIKIESPLAYSRMEIGSISAKVEPESIAGRFMRQILSVIIRESGF